MWNSQLIIYVLLFNCCLYFIVQSQELFLIDDDNTNSTNEEFENSTKDSLPVWTNQQFIVCFASVSFGTILFFLTFIIPPIIIIRRARRDKNRSDLRELRRMSDFL